MPGLETGMPIQLNLAERKNKRLARGGGGGGGLMTVLRLATNFGSEKTNIREFSYVNFNKVISFHVGFHKF